VGVVVGVRGSDGVPVSRPEVEVDVEVAGPQAEKTKAASRVRQAMRRMPRRGINRGVGIF